MKINKFVSRKLKINITKEQYRDLIIMSAIANSVLGILGDLLPDTDYKKRSQKMEKLEEYFLQYADDFDCGEFAQKHEGKNIFDDEMYEKRILPIMDDYDEWELFDSLANKLAWRDFRNDHSEAEIKEMAEKNGGYFGVEIYEYEKKYWDEFEKYEYERLEVKKKKSKL